jgi:hypothetical protein
VVLDWGPFAVRGEGVSEMKPVGLTQGLEFGHVQYVTRSGQNSIAQGLPWVS